ncbi:hypothetical protein [Ornithinimicrobium pekingense]|uniref:Uncharacterized protein n=1 Tax=Ornithinimicrobium pekingense TaxID=384677 RepID=A0ABQ2F4I4_9MICO|nr:hypothetical protein [Ornithinimicrobium pekingense]GGK61298.1 hypothetical protein GCM10011509_07010 [Ornithinimicrobium pekingense]
MSEHVPTSQADTRPFTKVLAVIPIGVAVLTVLFVLVDLVTGALHL